MELTELSGGVCAPKGFRASGVCCGIKAGSTKPDLGLLVSEVPAAAAAVHTQNKMKGAPNLVTKEHMADGRAQAVICNSGIANTCAPDGVEKALAMADLAARSTGIAKTDIVVASTGVIGPSIPIEKIEKGMGSLMESFDEDSGTGFTTAIMTTDTFPKETAVCFTLGGKTCAIGATAKGSGMIHPNMATMLSFVTTDAAITQPLLQKALGEVVVDTYNMVSIDGDTSTNDMVCVLANGLAGNSVIDKENEDYFLFRTALQSVCLQLSKMLAKDGEGATKLLETVISGAPDKATAKVLAKSVITSSLVKTAMFGADANFGRVLCALGYAEADFDITKVELTFASRAGTLLLCKAGAALPFDEEEAAKVLGEDEIQILIDLHQGKGEATAWGCDFTYDYVKINGDYRT